MGTGNTEFYKKANDSTLSIRDLFADVLKKHTARDGEALFLSGTSSTTPREDEMLYCFKKPWLFARVVLFGALCLLILYIVILRGYITLALTPFAFIGSVIVPISVVIFFMEMNVPRNIPIYEVLYMALVGGAISIAVSVVLYRMLGDIPIYFAPVVEEPAKLLAICIFLRKPKRYYILNGILVGGAVGAGFAIIETADYFIRYGYDMVVLLNRGVLSPGGHVIWAAIYGGALAMVKGKDRFSLAHLFDIKFLCYFGLTFLLHFIWNYDFEIVSLPLVVDLKFVLLIVAAWVILLSVIKAGLQQILAICNQSVCKQPVYNEPIWNQPVYEAPPSLPQQNEEEKYSDTGYIAIKIVSGENAGQTILIYQGSVVIGRDPRECNLVYSKDARGVSRKHCTIQYDGRNIFLVDHYSSNGTFLANGEKVPPGITIQIVRGQQIYLGDPYNAISIE